MNFNIRAFADGVQAICKRPKLYTCNGTYGEAIALIEGIAAGEYTFKNFYGHHSLDPFQRWLSNDPRFANSVNFTGFIDFRQHFESDEAALQEFSALFLAFCEQWPEEEDEIMVRITEIDGVAVLGILSDGSNKENESVSRVAEALAQELELLENRRNFNK